jgi:hypothetical protein
MTSGQPKKLDRQSEVRKKASPQASTPSPDLQTVLDLTREGFEEIDSSTDSADIPDQSDVRSIMQSRYELKENHYGRHPTLAIGDLEGEKSALTDILKGAGLINATKINEKQARVELTEKGRTCTVIQTGDIFDRGEHSWETLSRIAALKKLGIDLRLTVGNHELMALATLTSKSLENPLFYERIKQIAGPAHPDPLWDESSFDDFTRQHITDWTKADPMMLDIYNYFFWFKEGGFTLPAEIREKFFKGQSPTLQQILLKARDLFLQEDVAPVIYGMKGLERIDDILYVHAGLNDYWAEILDQQGIDGVNHLVQTAIKTGQLNAYLHDADKEGLFWLRNEKVLSAKAIHVLKKLGITTVVRGHDKQETGIPGIVTLHGITIINNDVCKKNEHQRATFITATGDIQFMDKNGYDKRKSLGTLPPLTKPHNEIKVDASAA